MVVVRNEALPMDDKCSCDLDSERIEKGNETVSSFGSFVFDFCGTDSTRSFYFLRLSNCPQSQNQFVISSPFVVLDSSDFSGLFCCSRDYYCFYCNPMRKYCRRNELSVENHDFFDDAADDYFSDDDQCSGVVILSNPYQSAGYSDIRPLHHSIC